MVPGPESSEVRELSGLRMQRKQLSVGWVSLLLAAVGIAFLLSEPQSHSQESCYLHSASGQCFCPVWRVLDKCQSAWPE